MTQEAAKKTLARLTSLPAQFGQELGAGAKQAYLDSAIAHTDGNVTRAVEWCLSNLSAFPTVKQFRDALVATRDAAPAKNHPVQCDSGYVCVHAYYGFHSERRATTESYPCPVCNPRANARTNAALFDAAFAGRLCKPEHAALVRQEEYV